jgi:hypothetical protein
MAIITLNSSSIFYPMPPGVSFEDTEAFGQYIGSLPPLAYAMVFLAHYGQAAVGGYLAAKLASETRADMCCYIVTALTMIGSIVNIMSLPVPLWTWLEVPFFPILAYYTARLAATGGKSRKTPSKE